MTVSEIRRRDKDYIINGADINLKYNVWGRFVLREVSYYLVWLFLRLGFSANLITGVGFLIGGLGCFFIASGNYLAMIIGALLVNLWALLDYTDGQVARCNNSSNNYGRFIDNLADEGMAVLLFVSLGVGVLNHPDPYLGFIIRSITPLEPDGGLFLFLGGWAAICYLYSLIIAYNFERLISPKLIDFVSQMTVKGVPRSLVQLSGVNLQNITGIIMPVLLLAVIFEFSSLILGLWALIGTVVAIFLAFQMIRRAKSTV